MIGSEKIVVPGIGTPMSMPINVRMSNIHAATFNVQEKLFPHGASSRWLYTITAVTPTDAMAKIGELRRTIEIAIKNDQIHHVSGCNDRVFIIRLFLSLQSSWSLDLNTTLFSWKPINSTDKSG